MPRPRVPADAGPDLTKHSVWLYRGDLQALAGRFPSLGASVVIRRLIRNYLKKLEEGQLPMNREDIEAAEVQL